ncbi:MAG TPA: methylated-DNA--[protein]-cysteine S-methyltransferase [Vineibacter sp.]|nr:methylated-DNA--[protein]-cysteine S-methyltransferase [Vineibacter sp.]
MTNDLQTTRPTVLLPAPALTSRVATARVRLPSPVGGLEVEATEAAVVAVHWTDDATIAATPSGLLAEARSQLEAYFAGRLRKFDLPLAPAGSSFERDVWRTMCDIAHGATMTYGDIAGAVGGEARDVGTACGTNPIPVVIPCHRVLGAGGRMVGYSGRGRIETKRWLLVHEGALLV